MADRKNSDALVIIDRRHFSTPEARAQLQEAEESAGVARRIYELRRESGLTQSDYEGHSLAMLRRVAAALGRRVEVRFVEVRSGTGDEPFGR